MAINRIKKIHLNKVGTTINDVRELSNSLINNLSDEIFTYQTRVDLLFNILNQIYPINRSLKPNESSIEKACLKVNEHFHLNRKVSIKVSTNNKTKEITRPSGSQTKIFSESILGLDGIPAIEYHQLLSAVNKDLTEITKLIGWYENLPSIKKINKSPSGTPRSHLERIHYDFYKRCIDQRIEILNYQINGLKERAINKARYTPRFLSSLTIFAQAFYDRPYLWAQPYSYSHFDFREIDTRGHRIKDLPINVTEKIESDYKNDKDKFYKKYFRIISKEHHYKKINYYLEVFPFVSDRREIFTELISLFKARRWASFYALALPQIEGLFSEMAKIVEPQKDLRMKTLKHKVSSVRSYHSSDLAYFDYYEYHIPLARNKFSHTGIAEDFRLGSFDLIVDLCHILEIFYELDNPLIKIRNLHKKRNPEDFVSLGDYVEYFKLINGLESSQRKSISNEINDFEKDFLIKNTGLEYTVYQVVQDLPSLLNHFYEEMGLLASLEGINVDIKNYDERSFHSLLNQDNKKEKLKLAVLYNGNLDLEVLSIFYNFFKNYKKLLPSLDPKLIELINKTETQYFKTLENIKLIVSKLEEDEEGESTFR